MDLKKPYTLDEQIKKLNAHGVVIADEAFARLTNLITEHWWNFFLGKEKFDEIAMLYPAKSVMGYTDMFLGYGIFHSFFRLIGLDMYIAYKYSIMLIFFIGGVALPLRPDSFSGTSIPNMHTLQINP